MRLLTLLGVLTLSAGIVSAQSLGEIARRDRERRASLGQPTRVLTNEDFRRERILQPAHEAAPQRVTQPSSEPEPALPSATYAVVPQTGISLGEYARRLREQRAARDLQEQLATSLAAPPAPAEQLPVVSPAPLPAASSMRFLSMSYEGVTIQPAVSLGEYARRLREQRAALKAQMQPAVAPAAERAAQPASGVSLGEYARRLQAEKRKPSEPVPAPPADNSAGVPLNVIGVQRGDSLWKLSTFYLGNGSSWVSLWKANPQVRNPNLIHPGQLLRLPASTELARSVKPAPKKAELAGLNPVAPAQALASPAAPEAAQGAGIAAAPELAGEIRTASEIFT